MPPRLVLDLIATASGVFGAMLALLQVERGELPVAIMWLAFVLAIFAAAMESRELLELVQR
jgi:hypothetical protein